MNRLLILLSLFLVASICFVTIPNTASADSQLDVLIKITQDTQEHINEVIEHTRSFLKQHAATS